MRHGWVKLPLEPAAPWFRLSALARCIGADLFRTWQARVVAGITIDQAEDVIVRMLAPEPTERRLLRIMLRQIIQAGLIVPVEGGIRLLYGPDDFAEHANKTIKVVTSSPLPSDFLVTSSPLHDDLVPAKSLEPLEVDSQIDREKERKREGAGQGGLRGASGAHGFEVSEAHRKAWSDAKAGTAPVLTGQPFTAAVEFARQVAKTHQKTLYEAAYAIASHVVKHSKQARDIPFDLARMDPFAAPRIETAEEHAKRANHVGESYEDYLKRKAQDPWAKVARP